MPAPVLSSNSRVFLIENRAGPAYAPEYLGWGRAGSPSWEQGDITPIKVPSTESYGKFDTVGKTRGEPGNPELPLSTRYDFNLSRLLQIVRRGCESDVQVHFGNCYDPRDFNGGWEKVLIIEASVISSWGTGDLGALEPGEEASVVEEATFSGEDMYEVKRITFATKAASQIVQEIVDVEICDTQSCGACGITSSGCDIIFAVTKSNGASPGLPAEVIFSQDGGLTWSDTVITSLGASDDPTDMDCVGVNLVVISNAAGGLNYAATADVLAGDETWAAITTGFEASGPPNAIHSVGATYTWIVGDGGYIYFSDDPASGVEVQDAGSATTENLNDVDFVDTSIGVAVGANNAVVYTTNGGVTWTSVTGPAVGVALNVVKVITEQVWWVGTANGKLFYTRNSGQSWVEKSFPGSGTGVVKDLKFSTDSVAWLSHTNAAGAGRILRSIDGGYSWYVAPEGSTVIPTNTGINALAPCIDPNLIYGGGAVTGGDGILVAGA
jgi:photosystem II stability/assembly factor-like uncharacterized protein